MDRIKKYEKIIISLLTPFEDESTGCYLIIDKKNHHYQVLKADWDSYQRYFFRVRIHLHIKTNGKIWIMENRVEEDMADLLVENAVPKSDIVLALLPESVRVHSGFAVA